MDQIPQPYVPRARVAANDEMVLSKVRTLFRRCAATIERSRVSIARSEQLIAESDQRMSGRTLAPRQPNGRPNNRISGEAPREQLRAARARTELLLRQTREIIARNRARMIAPV